MAAKKKATKKATTHDTDTAEAMRAADAAADTEVDEGPVHPNPDELARSTQHDDEEELTDPDFQVKPAPEADTGDHGGGEDPAASTFESVAAQATDATGSPRERLAELIDRSAVKLIEESDTPVGFGRILDAAKAANAGTGVSRELIKGRLLALVEDGKIQRAKAGEFHFVTT